MLNICDQLIKAAKSKGADDVEIVADVAGLHLSDTFATDYRDSARPIDKAIDNVSVEPRDGR